MKSRLVPKAAALHWICDPRLGKQGKEQLQHLPNRGKEQPFFKDRPRGEGRFGTIWCHIRKRRIIKLLQNSYCNSLEIVFYSANHYINFLLAQKDSHCFAVSHYFLYSCIRAAANGTEHCKFWPNSESVIIQLLCCLLLLLFPLMKQHYSP